MQLNVGCMAGDVVSGNNNRRLTAFSASSLLVG